MSDSDYRNDSYASSSDNRKPVRGGSIELLYDRSNNGFSGTMGDCYLAQAQHYIQLLGFTNINNRQQIF